jgi:hypothetical protein
VHVQIAAICTFSKKQKKRPPLYKRVFKKAATLILMGFQKGGRPFPKGNFKKGGHPNPNGEGGRERLAQSEWGIGKAVGPILLENLTIWADPPPLPWHLQHNDDGHDGHHNVVT